MALLIAVAIASAAMPALNDLAGTNLRYSDLFDPTVALVSLALALVVGMLSGTGPAFYLSSSEPGYALKGQSKGGNRGARLRNALVVCQFLISTSLVITTLVMVEQRSYLLNKKLGFNKEQVLVLPITADINHTTVKESFLRHPSVLAGTVSTCVPGRDVIAVSVRIRRDGANEDDEFVTPVIFSDLDLVQTFGLKVVRGRGYSAEFADVEHAMIINETAADLFGWEDPLGKRIRYANSRAEISGTVVGVVEDFHFASLHQEIEPMIMDARLPWASYISFNVALGEATGEPLSFMREAWREVHPDKPFDFFFLDAEFDRLHDRENAMGTLFGILSSVAILITCLGLFGLAVFSLERRTREMGVRKAFGASAASVARLFGLEFIKLLLVATLIAWPLAYWGVHSWLEGFAYRVELGIAYFLVGSLLVMGITLLTISSQAFKASRTNPVDLLRIE